jgi:hypothetical protein
VSNSFLFSPHVAFGSDKIEHVQLVEKIVSWSHPLEGIVALNMDGSVFFNVHRSHP